MIKQIKEDKLYVKYLAVFAVILVFFTSKMSPLFPTNDWADINVYFNIGKAFINGKTIYAEAFDHKGPLIFMIYGLGYLISNGSFLGMFFIQALAWIAFCVGIFYTAKLLLSKELSFLVAILTSVLTLNFTFQGGSAEEFILILAIWSMYLFLKYFLQEEPSEHSKKWMMTHGILMSCAFFIKLNLAIFWFFPVIGIFVLLLSKKEYKNLVDNALYGILGIAIVTVPILLYFIYNGALKEAYSIYVDLNSQYGGVSGFMHTLAITKGRLHLYMKTDYLGFALSMIGAFYFPLKFIKNKIGKTFMFLGCLSLVLMVNVPQSFHWYYPLSEYLFVPMGAMAILVPLKNSIKLTTSKRLLTVLVGCFLLIGIGNKELFNYGGYEILRLDKPQTVAYQFAETINKEENPTVVNLSLGYATNIFTICNIMPQHKYFLSPNFNHGMYPAMRDAQTKYIEEKSADFIIDNNFAFNHDYFKDLQILKDNYELVDICKQGSFEIYLYKVKKEKKE